MYRVLIFPLVLISVFVFVLVSMLDLVMVDRWPMMPSKGAGFCYRVCGRTSRTGREVAGGLTGRGTSGNGEDIVRTAEGEAESS